MKTIIFDLDGTLAHIEHRRKYLEQEKKDWKSFNHPDNIIQDIPNLPIIELFETLRFAKCHYLIIVTGRKGEETRHITFEWLAEHIGPFMKAYPLFMRKDGDYRADHIIKEEILKDLQAQGHDILFTVDDRQQVVDMWRRNGITCLQCAPGDF